MFKFYIEYYFERYHTGNTNINHKRQCTVYADNLDEAEKKIEQVDKRFISVANVEFEEWR